VTLEPCRYLDWDSDFFGKRIGAINGSHLSPALMARVDGWCAAQEIECLYFLADPDDIQTTSIAGAQGFRLVDIRVTLALGTKPGGQSALPARLARPSDIEVLAAMARQNHTDSRFFFDPGFPRESCEALYETWIRRSCEGYADAVYVVEWDARAAGYVTCHASQDNSPGRIGLLGVDAAARGRGVGEALLVAALDWLSQSGPEVTVVTQGRNLAAQALYHRHGFTPKSMELWYHWWRPVAAPEPA
jgi:dTDP-4-amino-4,6-dideoxy-D-galactose acyltransferase